MIKHTAGDRTPYTYLVTNTETGRRYYGVRFARNCHPKELWVNYFTSSRAVARDLKKHGTGAFVAEVRKVFDTAQSARRWESKVLVRLRVCSRSDWYNRTAGMSIPSMAGEKNPMHGKPSPMLGRKHSVEVRKIISEAKLRHNPQRGNPSPFRGRKHSDQTKRKLASLATGRSWGTHDAESKAKIGAGNKGQKRTPESKRKMSDAQKGRITSAETKLKISLAGKGRKINPESVKKRADKIRGRKNPKLSVLVKVSVTCPHCRKIGGKLVMSRFHFDRCKSKPTLSDTLEQSTLLASQQNLQTAAVPAPP